jgi:hypothetical protein
MRICLEVRHALRRSIRCHASRRPVSRRRSSIRCRRWRRPASATSLACRCPCASFSKPCCATAMDSGSASGTSSNLPQWRPRAPRSEEIPFVVARVVLQDFTGVPLLCDLAAMRHVAQAARVRSAAHRAAGAGRSGRRSFGTGRPLRHAAGAGAEHEPRVRAQSRALSVHEVGHAGFRHLPRRAARRRHRPSGQSRTSVRTACVSRRRRRQRCVFRTRWSVPTRTRR